MAAFAPFLSPERRSVLPSMAITSAGAPGRAEAQATKQYWNFSASSVAKMSPRWSCAGVPSRNGKKRRNRSSFLAPNRAISVKVSAPASTASRQSSRISSSGYTTLPACRGSGRSRKSFRKTMPSATAPSTAIVTSHTKSEAPHRVRTLPPCHQLLHPIALGDDPHGVDSHEHMKALIPAQPVAPADVGKPRQPAVAPALGVPGRRRGGVEQLKRTALGVEHRDQGAKAGDERAVVTADQAVELGGRVGKAPRQWRCT